MQIPLSLISAIIGGPLAVGYLTTFLLGYRRSIPTFPGLLFHSVLPHPRLNMSHFSSIRFKSFLQNLTDNAFKTSTLTEANNSVNSIGNRCLLTFDDGMECVYTHAFPLMEDYGLKSTIFCIAGYTGKSSSWDVFSGQLHMSRKQIIEIADSGHEIGSHTLTHANLTFLNDKDLEKELRNSKNILEDIIGKEVNALSFPYGSWNKHVWKKAQEVGYSSATLYRHHSCLLPGLFPVYGIYQFDKPADILNRLIKRRFSASIAASILMSHFSKGTPIVKFRKNYTIR